MHHRSTSLEQRVAADTKKGDPDACWEWSAQKFDSGYGRIWWSGKSMRAHRVAYVLTKGAIPAGLDVLHSCDNRGCVNPAHLSAGTHQRNMRERDERGRQARGARHGMTKLTDDQVREIFASGAQGSALADRFGVTRSLVSQIRRGVVRTHITGASL